MAHEKQAITDAKAVADAKAAVEKKVEKVKGEKDAKVKREAEIYELSPKVYLSDLVKSLKNKKPVLEECPDQKFLKLTLLDRDTTSKPASGEKNNSGVGGGLYITEYRLDGKHCFGIPIHDVDGNRIIHDETEMPILWPDKSRDWRPLVLKTGQENLIRSYIVQVASYAGSPEAMGSQIGWNPELREFTVTLHEVIRGDHPCVSIVYDMKNLLIGETSHTEASSLHAVKIEEAYEDENGKPLCLQWMSVNNAPTDQEIQKGLEWLSECQLQPRLEQPTIKLYKEQPTIIASATTTDSRFVFPCKDRQHLAANDVKMEYFKEIRDVAQKKGDLDEAVAFLNFLITFLDEVESLKIFLYCGHTDHHMRIAAKIARNEAKRKQGESLHIKEVPLEKNASKPALGIHKDLPKYVKSINGERYEGNYRGVLRSSYEDPPKILDGSFSEYEGEGISAMMRAIGDSCRTGTGPTQKEFMSTKEEWANLSEAYFSEGKNDRFDPILLAHNLERCDENYKKLYSLCLRQYGISPGNKRRKLIGAEDTKVMGV